MTTTEKQRILVTLKTYPTLSRTYGETVCTAGIKEMGECDGSPKEVVDREKTLGVTK